MFTKLRTAVSNMVATGWDQVAVGREPDIVVDPSGMYSLPSSSSTTSSSSLKPTTTTTTTCGVKKDGKARQSSSSGNEARKFKFPYGRPEFLLLGSEDEVQVAGDHLVRPIIVPRDISKLPWNAGYAEAVNAGKSAKNEDQATCHLGHLHRDNGRLVRHIDDWAGTRRDELQENPFIQSLPYYYVAVFDGHAGSGAAVAASRQLQHILHAKLVDVIDHLLPPLIKESDLKLELNSASRCSTQQPSSSSSSKNPFFSSSSSSTRSFWISTERPIETEKLIVGALESAFWEMDQMIGEDRAKYRINGGCTALVALFILGKLYVANAGDSRGIIVRASGAPLPMSNDFTPESERNRVQKVAAANPELLGTDFTHLDFHRRPFSRDVGQRVLYRDAHMTGFAYKTVTAEDLKCPVVSGEGKRSRVLATIGVTRGFGDHDLRAQDTRLRVKPFLSPEPEVIKFDLEKEAEEPAGLTEDDVLILGTDGLWDITTNERAAEIVVKNLSQFPKEDEARFRYRYTSAAQDLVMNSRGKLTERSWRLSDGSPATIDDVTAFVVPLLPYLEQHRKWEQEDGALREFFASWKGEVLKRVVTGVGSTAESAVLAAGTTKPKKVDQPSSPPPPPPPSSSVDSSGIAQRSETEASSPPGVVENGVEHDGEEEEEKVEEKEAEVKSD